MQNKLYIKSIFSFVWRSFTSTLICDTEHKAYTTTEFLLLMAFQMTFFFFSAIIYTQR